MYPILSGYSGVLVSIGICQGCRTVTTTRRLYESAAKYIYKTAIENGWINRDTRGTTGMPSQKADKAS